MVWYMDIGSPTYCLNLFSVMIQNKFKLKIVIFVSSIGTAGQDQQEPEGLHCPLGLGISMKNFDTNICCLDI